MDSIHVSFVVFDFGADPSVVTAMMACEPTHSWAAGDPIAGHPGVRRNHSRWTLTSGLGTEAPVEEQLVALIAILRHNGDKVRATARRYRAEIQCAIYYEDFTPGIHLAEDVIRGVADLGLEIDFDLYFLGEDTDSSDERSN